MNEYSERSLLDRLEQNLRRLMEQNRALRDENSRQKEEIQRQTARIAELDEKVGQLLVSKSLADVPGGAHSAKIRINRLLRDVDRCIALMNK